MSSLKSEDPVGSPTATNGGNFAALATQQQPQRSQQQQQQQQQGSNNGANGAAPPSLKDRIPKLEPRRRKAQTATNPTPAPATPALPPPVPDPSTLSFRVPTRRILTPHDHELFLASPTYDLILAFVFRLSESVADTPASAIPADAADLSSPVQAILAILDEAEALCMDSPPDDQGGSRFGNKVFRVFLDKVRVRLPEWHRSLLLPAAISSDVLPADTNAAMVAEVSTYLSQSFGNRSRIDYGSGHELNFVVWLLCLYRLGVVREPDFPALVLRVFSRYLVLMRRVQMTYYLEPAGSHGVWGLDDYQFLPFLFGASQLLHHAFLTPMAIHQDLALEEFGPEYLYLGQVAFVNSTKTVRGLRWHSPMLDDISSARGWPKVEAGMRRMFVAEVLRKLPVMQHFLFGTLVPPVEGMSERDPSSLLGPGAAAAGEDGGDGGGEDEDDEGGEVEVFDRDGVRHVHQANGWGDCCGIKVPSSLAAAEEMRKRGGGEQLRRIPFD